MSSSGACDLKITYKETPDGYRVASAETLPIFYITSAGVIELVETPAIEVLHHAVRRWTINGIAASLGEMSHGFDDTNKLVYERVQMEERFVHAILSILWLPKYNKQRNIGLTDRELDERVSRYEKSAVYKGTSQLAEHIIGLDIDMTRAIQKAIDQYTKDPLELFRRAGLMQPRIVWGL